MNDLLTLAIGNTEVPNTHARRIIARIFYTTPYVIVVAAIGFLFHQPIWAFVQWIGHALWVFTAGTLIVVYALILLCTFIIPVVPALLLLGIEAAVNRWVKAGKTTREARKGVIIVTCACYCIWIFGGMVLLDLGLIRPNGPPKEIDIFQIESLLAAALDLWILPIPYLLTYVPTLAVALYRGYRAIGRKIEG